jgi:hypothetical protein
MSATSVSIATSDLVECCQTPAAPRRLRDGGERGAALLIALLIMLLLSAAGVALVALTNTETLLGASYRHAQEAAYGAEAAFERALADLESIPDWSAVLRAPPGNLLSSLNDGLPSPRSPDGRPLDLVELTMVRQRQSESRDGPSAFGADAPQWRLFAHAPIEQLSSGLPPGPPLYLLVWVADDGMDGDGEAVTDSIGRVMVFAQAIGGGGTRRAVEGLIGRREGALTVLAWRRVP